jgi:hypothetical protein
LKGACGVVDAGAASPAEAARNMVRQIALAIRSIFGMPR